MLGLKRTVAIGGAAALAAAGVVVGIGLAPAQATVVGGASFSPASGNSTASTSLITDAPCAAPAVKVKATASGFGFPAGGINIYAPQVIGFSTTAPMTLQVSQAWAVYAANNSTPLVGDYQIRVQCVNVLGSVIYDEFAATITWTTPGNSLANINDATYTSTSNPPTTTPPSTEPPSTEPPSTEPPSTEPPSTEPPSTEPPSTEPPSTEPPTTAPPTTAPPVEDEVLAVDEDGNVLEENPELVRGETIGLLVAGFGSEVEVDVTMNSTPKDLGPVTADDEGFVEFDFTVPEDIEDGAHTLTFVGEAPAELGGAALGRSVVVDGVNTVTYAFTVAADDTTDPVDDGTTDDGTDGSTDGGSGGTATGALPQTGGSPLGAATLGVALLAFGAALAVVSRRRQVARLH